MEKRRVWDSFFSICSQLHHAVVNFYAEDSRDAKPTSNRIIKDNVPLEDATAVGIKVSSGIFYKDYHQVLIDIDVPHLYMPSSTPGHGHLIFRRYCTWDQYTNLLKAMMDAGLVEPGYYHATFSRGEGWLRTPWTDKGVAGNVSENFK